MRLTTQSLPSCATECVPSYLRRPGPDWPPQAEKRQYPGGSYAAPDEPKTEHLRCEIVRFFPSRRSNIVDEGLPFRTVGILAPGAALFGRLRRRDFTIISNGLR